MLLIKVNKQASEQSLIKFIKKILPKAPVSFIYKLFRKKDIKVNGKPQKEDYVIKFGEEIKLYITDEQSIDFGYNEILTNNSDKTIINHKKLEVLFEDENVLFVNKPIGLLSQKSNKNDVSLNDLVIDYIGINSGFKPSIVNRLDRNTSGIVAVGKSYVGLNELSKIFREKYVKKFYYTIAEGYIKEKIVLNGYIMRSNNISKVLNKKIDGASEIRTSIEPIEYIGNYTVCKIQLYTGRTHQIRAHLASIGNPIVGDIKYGSTTKYASHILHCSELIFDDNIRLRFKDFRVEVEPNRNQLYSEFIRRYKNGNMGN